MTRLRDHGPITTLSVCLCACHQKRRLSVEHITQKIESTVHDVATQGRGTKTSHEKMLAANPKTAFQKTVL